MSEATATNADLCPECGHGPAGPPKQPTDYIRPAEGIGLAEVIDGVIDVGGVKIELGRPGLIMGGNSDEKPFLPVFVRRLQSVDADRNGTVFDIALSFGDGLEMEESAETDRQAELHPCGPKAFWRDKIFNADGTPLSDEQYEEWFGEKEELDELFDKILKPKSDDEIDERRLLPSGYQTMSEDDYPKQKETDRQLFVGRLKVGEDQHPMTDEDFEAWWPKREQGLREWNERVAAENAKGLRMSASPPAETEVIVPAGEYFLGDPCYAAGDYPDDAWHGLVDQWYPRFSVNGRNEGSPVATLPDGVQILASSTAIGDGLYEDDHGNAYPVDAGCIGLVPVTEITKGILESTEKNSTYGQMMTRIRFDKPTRCYTERQGTTFEDREALLVFGDYRIWT